MNAKMTEEEMRKESGLRFETLLSVVRGEDVLTSRGTLVSATSKADALLLMADLTRRSRLGNYTIFDYERSSFGKGLHPTWIRESMRALGWVPTAQVDLDSIEGAGITLVTFHRPFPDSVYFVTGNPMKLLEMRTAVHHQHLHGCDFDVPELKHDDIETIAEDKARRSYAIVRRPVLCTDGGIFMDAYDGFPGPNSKQAATKLKPEGLLRLLVGVENRNGSRRNAAAFFDGYQMSVEVSTVPVRFATDPRGTYPSYPMDKILIPTTAANVAGLTYAEMPPEERGRTSEVPALAEYLERIAAAE